MGPHAGMSPCVAAMCAGRRGTDAYVAPAVTAIGADAGRGPATRARAYARADDERTRTRDDTD